MALKVLLPEQLSNKICVVVGTRPGIIKQGPVIRELQRRELPFFLLHTGQHYSIEMDATFFSELGLPAPGHRLEEPASCELHGEQTAAMLAGSERVFLEERPWLVLVGGDANTNLAAALAARKLHISVGHVEAGLRSFDWRMPEEHNRVMIDHISDFLFAPGPNALANLRNEAVRGQIEVVGNTIVDAVHQNIEIAKEKSTILQDHSIEKEGYLLMTLHREENVDDAVRLSAALDAVETLIQRHNLDVVFPAHPRTKRRLEEFGLAERAANIKGLHVLEAVGYLDFLAVLSSARVLMTDSGGAQQEACILSVPCVTVRENTEWVETVEIGANTVAGTSTEAIVAAVDRALFQPTDWSNPFGDGRAAARVIDTVTAGRGLTEIGTARAVS